MRDAFIAGLVELARKDERIALLTGDLGFGVVEKFSSEFPDRFWNCGVAEQSMMSIAAGLAKSGMRPFVYSIANFPTFRCLEQIRNDVCYHDLPVTIVSVGGGLGYGTLGYTHHGIEDIAALRALPNLAIYSPADPIETKEVLNQIHNENKPAYLRLGKNGEPIIEERTKKVLTGRIYEIESGDQVSIIACGSIVSNCIQASKELKEQVRIQVISVPKIQPLEVNFLQSTISSKKILIVEEHVRSGGFHAVIAQEFINEKNFEIISHLYVESKTNYITGSQEYLRKVTHLDVESIKKRCLELSCI